MDIGITNGAGQGNRVGIPKNRGGNHEKAGLPPHCVAFHPGSNFTGIPATGKRNPQAVAVRGSGACAVFKAIPVEILDTILNKMSETDVRNLITADDEIRHGMTGKALLAISVGEHLRRIHSLADFRAVLNAIEPSRRGAVAKPLTAAATAEPLPADIRDAVLAKLGGRILGLPQHEQADAAADLLSILGKRNGSMASDWVARVESIRYLKKTEEIIIKSAEKRCESCIRAQDVSDLAFDLGVSSPAGIDALKLQAAKALIYRGSELREAMQALEIRSREAGRKLVGLVKDEAARINAAEKQCESCSNAAEVNDLARRNGVSSSVGIEVLKKRAAKARIAMGKDVQSVANAFGIVDETVRKELAHYMIYETEHVRQALVAGDVPEAIAEQLGIPGHEAEVRRMKFSGKDGISAQQRNMMGRFYPHRNVRTTSART